MANTVYNWIDSLLSAVYPPTCVLCQAAGHEGMDICPGCLADLPHNRNCCALCALPLPSRHPTDSLCGECQRHAPVFDRCYSAFLYREPLSQLVTGLKFQARMHYGRLLGQLLVRGLREQGAPIPQVLLPVPLHPQRLRERGYNQSLEVARWVARGLGLNLDSETCTRPRATAAQSGLSLKERHRNMRGAFSVARPLEADRVAILDDVVTTGSTVTELAKVLKNAGAKRVDVWAVARTE